MASLLPTYQTTDGDIPIECLNETAKAVEDFNVFDFFLTYDELDQWLTALALEHPDKCRLEALGQTAEGRNINAITINYGAPKKIIVIGNLRAREYVGMTSAIYAIHELIRNADSYPRAGQYRWIIVPLPNPDGYAYTRSHNRRWTKNRSPQAGGNFGVDLDSNFDIQWQAPGNDARMNPAMHSYRGPAPFSEPETAAIGALQRQHPDALLHVDLHGFGQYIFVPWAYTYEPAPNADLARAVAEAGRSALMEYTQQDFEVGLVSDFFPFLYGTCLDYCDAVGIKACSEYSSAAFDSRCTNTNIPRCLNETMSIDDFNVLDFFLTYEETHLWLTALAEQRPDQCHLQTVGRSVEDREINALIVNYEQPRKVIVTGNLRAREWGAMTSTIYIMHELIRNAANYPDAARFQWIFVPIPNPDGYEYTRLHDRKWAKNRSAQPGGFFGVDLTRNFDVDWAADKSGTTDKPYQELYRGPYAFSEPETGAIRDVLMQHADAVLHVDMHTYGLNIIYPWSHTVEDAPNAELNRQVAEAGAEAILAHSGVEYRVGTYAGLFYYMYGTCNDYCNTVGIKSCIFLDLTPKGFSFSTDLIIPYGQEAMAAVMAMALKADEL
uniref:Peptidase M14 domain-containing protein n=1 Tax=Anopheles farauti TaxID=69004 RepID=A0A182QNK4_9DIPT